MVVFDVCPQDSLSVKDALKYFYQAFRWQIYLNPDIGCPSRKFNYLQSTSHVATNFWSTPATA